MEIWIDGVQIKIPKGSRIKSITISDMDGKAVRRKALDLVDKLFQSLPAAALLGGRRTGNSREPAGYWFLCLSARESIRTQISNCHLPFRKC